MTERTDGTANVPRRFRRRSRTVEAVTLATVGFVGAGLSPPLAGAQVKQVAGPANTAVSGVTSAVELRKVGIWYSTWYASAKKHVWKRGHGIGTDRQLLGDVTGDGRADAIAFRKSDGNWFAAASSGNGFNDYASWKVGHGIGSSVQFLADVTGDGKDDAIVYFPDRIVNGVFHNAEWDVAKSTGTSFTNYGTWMNARDFGSTTQLLGDVNGDGKDDAVAYYAGDGSWYVGLSNGSTAFAPYVRWRLGHGVGSTQQMLGDTDGDGDADAVAYFRDEDPTPADPTNGDYRGARWYIALSNRSSFIDYGLWKSDADYGAPFRAIGDYNGDGAADAIVAYDNGKWFASASKAKQGDYHFAAFGAPWKTEFPAPDLNTRLKRYQPPVTSRAVADADGNGTSDPVTYAAADGSWRWMPAEASVNGAKATFPRQFNYWDDNNIRFIPTANGSTAQYDSGNPSLIDAHLRMLGNAGIDFLLFDLTNDIRDPVTREPMVTNARKVCDQARTLRASGGPDVRVAVAIGGMQFPSYYPKPGTPPTDAERASNTGITEAEAEIVRDQFLDATKGATCLDQYFRVAEPDGSVKPLLVLFSHYRSPTTSGIKDHYDRLDWESRGGFPNTRDFAMRFANPSLPLLPGELTTSQGSDDLQAPAAGTPGATLGNGCGVEGSIPASDPPVDKRGQYFGWGTPYGALRNTDVMVAVPGWNPRVSRAYVHRKQKDLSGTYDFYRRCVWDRIIEQKPKIAVINSFNEFAEETAVEPADTSKLGVPVESIVDTASRSETWPTPSYYWDMTVDRIKAYKALP